MTTNMNTPIANLLTEKILLSDVAGENDFDSEESYRMAEELLDSFLVMHKSELPEAKHMDTMIYAGSQAVNANAKPEDVLEKALSYLAAAAKLTEIQAELKAAQEKEKKELLDIINEFTRSSPNNVASYDSMTNVEILAAREIKRLRRAFDVAVAK